MPSTDRVPIPGNLFKAFFSYQMTEALRTAIDLDLFTAIGAGATTAKALAAQCKASERGVRMLADYLVVNDFLTKEGDRYGLAPIAAMFLDQGSPACMASAIRFMASPFVMDGFQKLTEAVRAGGTASRGDQTETEHPMWVEFARSMAPLAGFTARLLANLLGASTAPRWRVLDIAAGHGLFGITLAQENPNAEIVALDWKSVLAVAEENARTADVMGRYRTLPGNALEVEYGSGYDLVLLTNILHQFDPVACGRLLRKVHAALAPGGRAVAVEFVPDETRVKPPHAAEFALTMLAGTPGGDAYTFAEYERMFRDAGFARCELHDLTPSPQQVLIAHRA
jgi:2-polyprenyl-3-methyl-5-hydroxy-6-metoxy-1,4-benzoquinol methylase